MGAGCSRSTSGTDTLSRAESEGAGHAAASAAGEEGARESKSTPAEGLGVSGIHITGGEGGEGGVGRPLGQLKRSKATRNLIKQKKGLQGLEEAKKDERRQGQGWNSAASAADGRFCV
uniref:Uncharacterized protein n=1 Tax=Hemiselmis andersenii TaxID=464988 RepID=A0A6T8MUE2_HEMAN|mmetsp:Transcript_34436/g.80383  ORF Transcript_34436/g.80383 Transcript_34436/m.80383 type:complete len:118 (+) Transcript_34436:391-744(+)